MSQIPGKSLTCRFHYIESTLRQLSDNKDADVTIALRTFREGDRVRAYIISRNLEKKQLSLGLKSSYFTGDDEIASGPEQPQDGGLAFAVDANSPGTFGETSYDEKHSDSEEEEPCEAIDADDDDNGDDISMQADFTPPDPTDSAKLRTHQETSLKIDGFQWFASDAGPYEESQSERSDQSDDEENPTDKRRRKKRKEIEMDATADMHTKLPDSNADFERMLLGSPNSSYLWIQYMSFQLQLSEIDKARAIGQRAIQTIHFREEQEKLNVWIALLNLENVYGTDTTIEAVFKDAARHNDSKTVHLRLATIFDESGKCEVCQGILLLSPTLNIRQKTEEQYKRTCKKFGQSSKVWTLFCEYYLRRGLADEARKLLSRSLQSLEKRKRE